MSLRASLSEHQAAFQGELFPALEEALGPLPERYGRFVQVLEFVLVDAVVLPSWPGGPGRPPEDRRALARAFFGEGGVRRADDAGADRAPADRQDAAAAVRLDAGGGGADPTSPFVVTRFCRVGGRRALP